ncbi:MAG: NTP pyrophosphohydrolase [Bacillus thermozeamaize]|jgi:8-oxo-dGTP pyrophosphatase MutT (NUDIX family)|uniref:NTP pyrophosphohydrolase n=1 Tax=Bacillus thermozeamaize TaxID=230954 RepID=A0A1Y3PMX3_9BACI|nr:MAG: NTP pyrophosphohydrolase [Bacillus thermozeamaize]
MREISAGGLVYRRLEDGSISLLSLTDRFGRYSLPKGKQEQGETLEETALREIREETAITGEVEQPLGVVAYTYYHPEYGQMKKEVHYYLVRALTEELHPQLEEISGIAWVDPDTFLKCHRENGYENNTPIIKQAWKVLGI